MDEAARIERILAAARAGGAETEGPEVVLGPGDDAALLLPPPGCELVWTTDEQLEDAHFRRSWTEWAGFAALGRKAAGASLSDLAAMGARPLGALLSLRAPRELAPEALAEVARGIGEQLGPAACPLVGGNLARDPARLGISVEVLGAVERGRALRRDAGRAGDRLFVSGPLGWARLALLWLEEQPRPAAELARELADGPWARALAALLRPRPRLELGRVLAGRGERIAAMDLSDGLARDLPRLALASGLAAEVTRARLPGPDPALCAALGRSPADLAWEGGEDYELLVAGPAELAEVDGLTEIGHLVAGEPGRVSLDGTPVTLAGFDHFAD
ncbi:MAG: thiamine-phosphate kinase [Planctomycetota bacterium]